MVYLSCMTTTTSSDFPSFLVCCNCGHEHQSVDLDDIVIIVDGYVRPVNDADEIKDGATVLCADEDACERRMGRMEPLPDLDDELPGIDPEPDTDEDEGEPFYCEDHTGQDREDGWD